MNFSYLLETIGKEVAFVVVVVVVVLSLIVIVKALRLVIINTVCFWVWIFVPLQPSQLITNPLFFTSILIMIVLALTLSCVVGDAS